MLEFEVDGHRYRAEKLTAFQQFHLSRKISPLVPPLTPILLDVSKSGGKLNFASLPVLLQPFADGLATMTDEATEYVLGVCLSVVKRQTTNDHWASIWNAPSKRVMFEDLNDLSALIPITIRVIQENLGPFIAGLLTAQQIETGAAA